MHARDNPFATDRVLRARYRPQGWTWEQLLDRLDRLDYCAAIVGAEGGGKTTLLEDLGRRLSARGMRVRRLRLTCEERALPSDWPARKIEGDVILLDGAEQLTRPGWWRVRRVARRARGLVITSHRPGLLQTLVECESDVQTFRAVVNDLLPRGFGVPLPPLEPLFEQCRGNFRDAIRALYDWCAAAGAAAR